MDILSTSVSVFTLPNVVRNESYDVPEGDKWNRAPETY